MDLITPAPLNPLEQSFKQLYLDHPERQLQIACSTPAIKDLLNEMNVENSTIPAKMFLEHLVEDSFFNAHMDIAVYDHIRYLPAQLHEHIFYELIYVAKGHCEHTLLGQTHELTEGDLCIVGPNTIHTISCFNDESSIINILIRSSTFKNTFGGMLQEKDLLTDFFYYTLSMPDTMPYILFKTGKNPQLESLILDLKREISGNKRYKKRMANAILNLFFIFLLRNHDKDVTFHAFDDNRSNQELIYLLRYIQDNYAAVTLHHLSQFFNFSERQIQRMIKKATGHTFRDIILRLKMEKACNYLEHAYLTVEEISEKLGYSDVSNFRHAFKREMGCSPSSYRQMQS